VIVYLPGSGARCLRHNGLCNGWSYCFEELPPCDPPKYLAVCVSEPLSEQGIAEQALRLANGVDRLVVED